MEDTGAVPAPGAVDGTHMGVADTGAVPAPGAVDGTHTGAADASADAGTTPGGTQALDGTTQAPVETEAGTSAVDALARRFGASLKQALTDPRAAWAVAAVLCATMGIVASVLGAHAVVRNDAANERQSFQQSATSIASTLKVAIRHDEQLAVSASTYFGEHPRATYAEFEAWVNWARTRARYPELDALGFMSLAHPTSTMAFSRDTGLSIYTSTFSRRGPALMIQVPVYRGTVTPRNVLGRRAASIGWVREVLIPGVVLREALTGKTGYTTVLAYRGGPADLLYTSGASQIGGSSSGVSQTGRSSSGASQASGSPGGASQSGRSAQSGAQSGAQSAMRYLPSGWSVAVSAPPPVTGVFGDGDALALLVIGVLASAFFGLLVYLLGTGALRRAPVPQAREVPHEDLYDTLTGLPNRALMLDRAERILARTGRQSETVAGALAIEIDWLKDVNDRLGREAGDRLVQVVAQRLEHVIRTGDTVGRLGGDEFVVLVESSARGIRLDSLARRILEALHEPVELEGFGPSFVLTASIGVAFGRYTTPTDLFRDAHTAAQTAGKDRYTLFNANMRSLIESHGVLEAELSTALAERQFFLLYQPIRELSSQRVVGAEALIRWHHPTRGVLAPADFLGVAEDTGLIVPIGRWALEEACARAAAWSVAGHRAGVSVSVSASQLSREGFVTDVRRALQQSGIEPVRLTLEVDADSVMHNVAEATERLEALKQLGVRIALDDFGGGYTSHADLRRLPLDFLKVDCASLASSETEEYRNWLLETILLASRDLSLMVIAKGIETPDQMHELQEKGCRMAQGMFLGAPVPADAVEGLFAAVPAPGVPVPSVPGPVPASGVPAAVPVSGTPAPVATAPVAASAAAASPTATAPVAASAAATSPAATSPAATSPVATTPVSPVATSPAATSPLSPSPVSTPGASAPSVPAETPAAKTDQSGSTPSPGPVGSST